MNLCSDCAACCGRALLVRGRATLYVLLVAFLISDPLFAVLESGANPNDSVKGNEARDCTLVSLLISLVVVRVQSPLMRAAFLCCQNTYAYNPAVVEIVQVLLKHKADVDYCAQSGVVCCSTVSLRFSFVLLVAERTHDGVLQRDSQRHATSIPSG